MQRLYNKARQTSVVADFRPQLPLESQYGPDDGLYLDETDQSSALKLLAVHSIVKAVSLLDDDTDKSGFRASVDGVGAKGSQLRSYGKYVTDMALDTECCCTGRQERCFVTYQPFAR